MSFEKEIYRILDIAEQYLNYQKEIYGDLLLTSTEISKTTFMKIEKTSEQTHQTTEFDLFGNPIEDSVIKSKSKKAEHLLKYPDEPWINAQSLNELDNLINSCTKCSLGNTRKKFVFGVGNPNAEVVVVGEAPGAEEDEQGEPFVGRGGQLLNKILEAIRFQRNEVYICNVLKCRPPNNRDPLPEEIDLCEPYLWKQLEIIKPKIILCAGRIAGQALLKTNDSLVNLRSKVHYYRGIPLIVTYHPAALLRNPHWKRPCWEDVQQFRKLYDEIKKEGK